MQQAKYFADLSIGDSIYRYDVKDKVIYESKIVNKYFFTEVISIQCDNITISPCRELINATVLYHNNWFYTSFEECKKAMIDYYEECLKLATQIKKPFNAKEI